MKEASFSYILNLFIENLTTFSFYVVIFLVLFIFSFIIFFKVKKITEDSIYYQNILNKLFFLFLWFLIILTYFVTIKTLVFFYIIYYLSILYYVFKFKIDKFSNEKTINVNILNKKKKKKEKNINNLRKKIFDEDIMFVIIFIFVTIITILTIYLSYLLLWFKF